MTTEQHFGVEPVVNTHRVAGTKPSDDRMGKKRQYPKGGKKKPDGLDETIESKVGEQDDDETFHVIDYRA